LDDPDANRGCFGIDRLRYQPFYHNRPWNDNDLKHEKSPERFDEFRQVHSAVEMRIPMQGGNGRGGGAVTLLKLKDMIKTIRCGFSRMMLIKFHLIPPGGDGHDFITFSSECKNGVIESIWKVIIACRSRHFDRRRPELAIRIPVCKIWAAPLSSGDSLPAIARTAPIRSVVTANQ
jgi:hypothetical protein